MSRETWKKRRDRLFKGTYEGVDAQVVEVLRLLHKAWNERPIPNPINDVGYTTADDESGAVYAIYGGRDWREINPPDVSDGYACMTLMTSDVAKGYYMGTYMLRILEGHMEQNINYDLAYSIEVVLHNIIERGNLTKVFTRAQLTCVQRFYALPLSLLDEHYGHVLTEIDRVLASGEKLGGGLGSGSRGGSDWPVWP